MRQLYKVLLLLLGALFATSILFSSSIVNQFTPIVSAQTSESQAFTVINSQWGTPAASVQAGPGDQDVPLTITMQYLYSYPSISTEFEIKLPSGITSTSSSRTGQDSSNATAYYVNRLEQGQIFQITLYLDLANNTSLGEYTLSSTILWYAILSNSTSMPEVYLDQTLNLIVNLNGNANLMYSTNDTALTPDKINYISLTLINSGSGNVTDLTTTVSDTSPTASILNELPSGINLAADSTMTETLQVFVPEATAGSIFALNFVTTYLDPYQNQEQTTQSLGFFVSSLTSATPLTYSINQTSLIPGGINNLTMVVTNTGSSPVSNILTTVSVPSSAATSQPSTQSLSVLSQPATIDTLAPGSSVTLHFSVFVSTAAAGTSLTLTLGSTYISATGLGQSSSSSYGLYVSNLTTTSGPVISVSELSNYVTTGVPSRVALLVDNAGQEPMYSPSFTLTTTSPLFLSSNSTFTMTGSRINPGNGITFEPTISSGPSSTVGVYGGSLTVSYTNQFGVASTQVVQVSFTLVGRIDLVVQGEVISQSSGTNLTLSGTLLNEGTVSAYYASAAGYVQGANANPNNSPLTYVGEIDVNTPVPFTVTVPYTTGTTSTNANITLLVSYQDSFGRNSTYVSTTSTMLLSAAQLSQQSSASQTTSQPGTRVESGLIAIILIVIIVILSVGIIVVWRRGKKPVKKSNVV